VRILVAAIAVVAVAACDSEEPTQFSARGIALDVPSAWSVTGFSEDVVPPRLVVASYGVLPADVEGDCGGRAAILRATEDGAYVLLIDYGPSSGADGSGERTTGRDEPFSRERFGDFECFGPSYLFRFVVAGRALQAHIGIGPDASQQRRDEAVAVLRSITVSSRGRRRRGRARAGRSRRP
jgi:hypothetical protein